MKRVPLSPVHCPSQFCSESIAFFERIERTKDTDKNRKEVKILSVDAAKLWFEKLVES
jgi:hypothetical protein